MDPEKKPRPTIVDENDYETRQETGLDNGRLTFEEWEEEDDDDLLCEYPDERKSGGYTQPSLRYLDGPNERPTDEE